MVNMGNDTEISDSVHLRCAAVDALLSAGAVGSKRFGVIPDCAKSQLTQVFIAVILINLSESACLANRFLPCQVRRRRSWLPSAKRDTDAKRG